MSGTARLVSDLYAAFQRRDHQAMAACYGPNAEFHDPVFETLRGWKIAAMWRMLCERATDLELTTDRIAADGDNGSAHWEARYTFTATGRRVHNLIEASFVFADGKIVRHVDRFDLHRWASQALGLKGRLLGWAPPVQRAIRGQAARGLDSFIRKNALGPG